MPAVSSRGVRLRPGVHQCDGFRREERSVCQGDPSLWCHSERTHWTYPHSPNGSPHWLRVSRTTFILREQWDWFWKLIQAYPFIFQQQTETNVITIKCFLPIIGHCGSVSYCRSVCTAFSVRTTALNSSSLPLSSFIHPHVFLFFHKANRKSNCWPYESSAFNYSMVMFRFWVNSGNVLKLKWWAEKSS